MAATPAVSIIVPAYNTAHLIGETLESIAAQTYTDYEVIVVNDGSPDTPALERALEPHRERIVYLRQENRGVSAARNTAIRASRGEYIALIDSDDTWEPEYLEVQVAALEADPTLDVVYPDARIVGDHPKAGRTYMDVYPSRGEVTFEALVTLRCNVLCSVLARRAALVRAGLYDASLRCVEDFDLWLRVVATGGRIGYHRRVLMRLRRHPGSLSSDLVWMAEHVVQVLDKTDRTLALTPAARETLRRQRAYFQAQLALTRGKRAFFDQQPETALRHLHEANTFFRSPKISVACALIRTAPRLLLRAYDWRDRLLIGASTRF
jgi:glycosyltransferase involved in cell wall biosynthesis